MNASAWPSCRVPRSTTDTAGATYGACMSDDTFLDRLDPVDRRDLLDLGREREHDRDQVLFFEGDPGHDVHVLIDGQVKATITSRSGREVILDVIDAGSLLGELSAVDGAPRSATATVLRPALVRVVAVTDFVAYLESHPSAATEMVRMMAQRLRQTSQRQLEFGTRDALGRLCAYLIEMNERYGQDDGSVRRVTLPLAQHDIAAMTGLSREAVVKGLRAMRALEWIDGQGRDLVVLDRQALVERADRDT